MSQENKTHTLYVGNLHYSITDEFLYALFSQIGEVLSCKIIRDPGSDHYGFLEFRSYEDACKARITMHKRVVYDKELKVNWAFRPSDKHKINTNKHHHVFVGDLSPEVDVQMLKNAFKPYGEISNCRVVKNPATFVSKGYAFVTFVRKCDADSAIKCMNGQWLGSRPIKTNWSNKQYFTDTQEGETRIPNLRGTRPTYDDIYNQASPQNSTVYFGGFPINTLTEDIIISTFSPFGTIEYKRIFQDKGYSFIKFSTKDMATRAIEAIHKTEIEGFVVKCSWGKECENVPMSFPQTQQEVNTQNVQYPYRYEDQTSHWYSQYAGMYNYQQYAGPSGSQTAPALLRAMWERQAAAQAGSYQGPVQFNNYGNPTGN